MKNRFARKIVGLAIAGTFAGTCSGVRAQDEAPLEPGAAVVVEMQRDPKAEKIGLMPYQKTPVDVGAKERNPFANRAPEKKEAVATEENKEEDRIRMVLSELPIGGVSRGRNGGLQILLGDMKLERGAVVPQVLSEQTAQLMVALITDEKIEFAWLEESGKGTGRRLVLPIDIQPKVTFVLNGQHGKAEEERATGFQLFPSHHRRDTGIISDTMDPLNSTGGIGTLDEQYAPR